MPTRELKTLSPPRTASSPGYCIYCRSTHELSDEHIIPYALAGNYILQRSSCPNCSEATSRIEGHLMRKDGLFFGYRERKGYPTRRTRKNSLVPVTRSHRSESGMVFVNEHVDRAEYPDVHTMPVFSRPGSLMGRPPTKMFQTTSWIRYSDDEETLRGFVGPEVDVGIFAKFIAKVAHSFAYAELGRQEAETYVQYLPPVIIGNFEEIPYVVGGERNPQASFGMVRSYVNPARLLRNGLEFLYISIRLFHYGPTHIGVFGYRNQRPPEYYQEKWAREREKIVEYEAREKEAEKELPNLR